MGFAGLEAGGEILRGGKRVRLVGHDGDRYL